MNLKKILCTTLATPTYASEANVEVTQKELAQAIDKLAQAFK